MLFIFYYYILLFFFLFLFFVIHFTLPPPLPPPPGLLISILFCRGPIESLLVLLVSFIYFIQKILINISYKESYSRSSHVYIYSLFIASSSFSVYSPRLLANCFCFYSSPNLYFLFFFVLFSSLLNFVYFLSLYFFLFLPTTPQFCNFSTHSPTLLCLSPVHVFYYIYFFFHPSIVICLIFELIL
jgi:hypothetical protein